MRRTIIALLVALGGVCAIVKIFSSVNWRIGHWGARSVGRGEWFAGGGSFRGGAPDLSPDGTKVVFASPRYELGDICTIDRRTGHWERLTNTPEYEGEPVFSPDGSEIAFISERDGNGEIYIMDADGKRQTRLTHSPEYEVSPCFSPSGKRLVFVRCGDPSQGKRSGLFVINTTGAKERLLLSGNRDWASPVWPHDGNRILFLGNSPGLIWSILPDGSGRNLYAMVRRSVDGLAPNGDRVLTTLEVDAEHYGIYVYSLRCVLKAEPLPVAVAFVDGRVEKARFSRRGDKVVFLREKTGGRGGTGTICVLDLDGGNVRAIGKNY